jgi:hypothetical protein
MDETEHARGLAIDGWAITGLWVADREGSSSTAEAIGSMDDLYPSFQSAPDWLRDGVAVRLLAG